MKLEQIVFSNLIFKVTKDLTNIIMNEVKGLSKGLQHVSC